MLDSIDFWSRVTESSPVIVLLLLAGYIIFGRGSYVIITSLLARLDRKDEQIMTMQRETLMAVEQMRKAVDNLTDALRDVNRK